MGGDIHTVHLSNGDTFSVSRYVGPFRNGKQELMLQLDQISMFEDSLVIPVKDWPKVIDAVKRAING